MANEPKMKIGIGADTGDFDKGAKKVKQEMKDLSKVSSDAFGAIGNAIGVDTGKLTQFSSALQGLGRKFTEMGKEGSSAFTAIGKALNPLSAGIAGLGIAAAVVAFKSLKQEAEDFKNTVEGANMAMAAAAYVETYNQVLRDLRNSGKDALAMMNEAEKKTGTFWQRMKTWMGTGANAMSGATPFNYGDTAAGINQYTSAIAQAEEAGNKAENLTLRILELEDQRKKNAIEIAKLNAQIADNLGIARDTTASVAARQKAMRDIEADIEKKKQIQIPLERELAQLYKERSDLAEDSKDGAAETMAQEQRLFETERALQLESNSLLKVKNQIASAVAASAKAAKEEADNIARIKALRESGGGIQAIGGGVDLSAYNRVEVPVKPIVRPEEVHEFKAHIVEELGGGITIAIAIDPDSVEKIHDITNEINSMVENMAVSVGEALGQLAGNLINGEDPWGQFANAALSAMGDMAVSVGKMAISTGVATLGIKAALESLNGYVAIAAGVALVALGAAVKTGLSNVASGNYSASMGTVSNTSSSISNSYEQRDVYVKVDGVLRADGNQLLAVINSTEKKNNVTT